MAEKQSQTNKFEKEIKAEQEENRRKAEEAAQRKVNENWNSLSTLTCSRLTHSHTHSHTGRVQGEDGTPAVMLDLFVLCGFYDHVSVSA